MFCDECTDQQKEFRGCRKKALQPVNLDGEVYEYCPVRNLTRITSRYMTAYSFFSKDILPCSGGYGDQGNKAIEAILYLSNLQNKADREKTKKTKTGSKNYAPPGSTGQSSLKSKPKPPTKSFKKGRPPPKRTSVRAKKV